MNIETKAKLQLALKSNIAVRFVAAPFVIWRREKKKREFHNTKDAKKLRALKNKFEGKRCFIIGNGPSLTVNDLNKLRNEYAFASNKILYLFGKTEWRPTFYCCCDPEVYLMIKGLLDEYNLDYKFLNFKPSTHEYNEYSFFEYTPFTLHRGRVKLRNVFVSEDISQFIQSGLTVTFTAIQIAIYLGFKEIYLLGVDHSYAKSRNNNGKLSQDYSAKNYADGIPDWGKSVQNIDVSTYAYHVAREYCETNGIKIYNATRGGKLEVFKRVDFDTLF